MVMWGLIFWYIDASAGTLTYYLESQQDDGEWTYCYYSEGVTTQHRSPHLCAISIDL